MNPKELIAELEAARDRGESHDWRLLAPLLLDAWKVARAAIERLGAERDEARAELSRLTTPRPIAEAPKDGTWVLGLWPDVPRFSPELLHWVDSVGWVKDQTDGHYHPTHFLPLPVKP